MNTNELKANLHSYIDQEKNDNLLSWLYSTLVDEKDFWDNLPQPAKDSIQRGLEQSEKEETTPHKDVIDQYRK